MIGPVAPAFIGILITAAITVAANILLRIGLQRFGGYSPNNVSEVINEFIRLLLEPYFLVGFVAYFIAALVWFRTINLAPLSATYPILVGLTYLGVTIGSILIWREPLTFLIGAGACLIIIGILLISMSSSRI